MCASPHATPDDGLRACRRWGRRRGGGEQDAAQGRTPVPAFCRVRPPTRDLAAMPMLQTVVWMEGRRRRTRRCGGLFLGSAGIGSWVVLTERFPDRCACSSVLTDVSGYHVHCQANRAWPKRRARRSSGRIMKYSLPTSPHLIFAASSESIWASKRHPRRSSSAAGPAEGVLAPRKASSACSASHSTVRGWIGSG